VAQSETPPINQTQAREQIQANLKQALNAETAKLKNYYIRCAMQYCAIQDELR
jgi:hypothetical protein